MPYSPASAVHEQLGRIQSHPHNQCSVWRNPDLVVCDQDRVLVKKGAKLYYWEDHRPCDVSGAQRRPIQRGGHPCC
jgi:hypothetical protein